MNYYQIKNVRKYLHIFIRRKCRFRTHIYSSAGTVIHFSMINTYNCWMSIYYMSRITQKGPLA